MKISASHQGIGKTAGTLIAAIIFLAATVVIEIAPASTNKTATLSSESTPVHSGVSTDSTGSSTSNMGDNVAIVVDATVVDKTTPDAPSGYTTYIYNLAITDVNIESFLVTPDGFKVFTTSNATYGTSLALAMKWPLHSTTLGPGQSASGQVSFQVPNGQLPTKLEYGNTTQSVDALATNLPQPTQWVSTVDYANATLQGTGQSEYLIVTMIPNSIPFYYSADGMLVTITLQAFVPNATSINVTSVAVANYGFRAISVTPALPVLVPNDGTKVTLTLRLSLPQDSLDVQDLVLIVTTS